MSFTSNLIKFCKRNTVYITGGGIIIGIHWMWYKIQQVPEFVPEHQRKDMPLIAIVKGVGNTIAEAINSFTANPKEDKLPPPTKE